MMKLQAGFPILIVISIGLVQPQIVSALSAIEVAKVAKSITVLIKANDSSGSGVIVNKSGNTYTLLTAGHVVTKPGSYKVITPDNRVYSIDYSTVKKLSGVDLALVRFSSTQTYPIAKMGDSKQSPEGAAIYVAGFPVSKVINNSVYNFTEGKITANANRPLENGYALVYTNPTLPGMSGGSILNDRGELIGIHGRADTTDRPQNAEINPDVYIKTGFNLGIPINTYLSLVPTTSPATNARPVLVATTQLKADDFYLQGVNKQDKNDLKGAVNQYTKAIALNPRYVRAYEKRANLRNHLGDVQGSLSDYTKAIELEPKNASAYFNRGSIRDKSGDKQGALSDFQTYITLSNDSWLVENAKAKIRRLQTTAPTVTKQPDSSPFSTLITATGDAKSQARNYQGAIDDYDRAIALSPQSAEAYIGRGRARNGLIDQIGASEDFNRAIALSPNNATFYIIRGNARFDWREQQAAINDFNQAIAIDPMKAEAYFARGYAYTRQFNRQAAIEDYNRAIALNPKYGAAYFYRGEAYFNLTKYRQANKDLSQAIALVPNWAEAYEQRGKARSGLGDKQGKLADFQRAAKIWQQSGDKFRYEMISDTIRNLQQCGSDFCKK